MTTAAREAGQRGARGWARVAGVLVLALVAGGCSSDDGDGDADVGGGVGTTTSLAPEGFPVLDVVDREEERWEVLTSPDWLASDGERIFVKGDSGAIDAVDPATDELTRVAEVASAPCQGIGFGFGSLWTCAESDVVRIDPATGEVTSTLAVGKAAAQGHLPTGFERVWVLTGDGSTLVGVDPDTEEVAVTAPLGVRGAQVETGEAGLWVASTLDDQLLQIDPETGEVLQRIETILKPSYLVVAEDVWVGASLSTNKVDPATGEVLATSDIGTGPSGSLAVTDGAVWVRSEDRFLVRLDPTDLAPVEGLRSPDTPSGGDTLVAFGSVWTTAYDDATLLRIAVT